MIRAVDAAMGCIQVLMNDINVQLSVPFVLKVTTISINKNRGFQKRSVDDD